MTLDQKLAGMQSEGSGVVLDWGEDSDMWECSWITGGKRFTSHGKTPEIAVDNCILTVGQMVNQSLRNDAQDSQARRFGKLGDL